MHVVFQMNLISRVIKINRDNTIYFKSVHGMISTSCVMAGLSSVFEIGVRVPNKISLSILNSSEEMVRIVSVYTLSNSSSPIPVTVSSGPKFRGVNSVDSGIQNVVRL